MRLGGNVLAGIRGAVRNVPQAAHFTITLGNRYGDRLPMDVRPKNRNFSFMTCSFPLVVR